MCGSVCSIRCGRRSARFLNRVDDISVQLADEGALGVIIDLQLKRLEKQLADAS